VNKSISCTPQKPTGMRTEAAESTRVNIESVPAPVSAPVQTPATAVVEHKFDKKVVQGPSVGTFRQFIPKFDD
jgi:hypothetical protein